MRFNVTWSVAGSSTVDLDERELAEARAAGVDFLQDDHSLFMALNKHFGGDLLSEAVSDFDERDAPDLIEVLVEEVD